MTALNVLLDSVMQECNFRAKGNYANAASQNEQQLFRLANRSVTALMEHPWQALRKEHEFTLTAATDYPLPSDYHGFIVDTFMANNRAVPVDTDTQPSIWAWLRTNTGSGGIEYRTRFWDNKIEVFEPSAGDVLRFEYWSNAPIESASAVPLRRFAADSDEWLLDDDLLIMDIVWRFKKAKGLDDWQVDRVDAEDYLKGLKRRERPAKTVHLGNEPEPFFGEPYTDLWITP